MKQRSAGILLHPTSLPGRFGIGDLGPQAELFLDWVQQAGSTVWQVLPLGPSAVAGSPYTSLSAFAGNPLLISPERLLEEGLLDPVDLEGSPPPVSGQVQWATVIPWKEKLLKRTWEHFRARAGPNQKEAFESFCRAPEQLHWLDDWALFSCLRQNLEPPSWWHWPEGLRNRYPEALEQARRQYSEEISYHRFLQYLFISQWNQLHQAALDRGIKILGDLPIYVALDSAEVWTYPHFFELDDNGHPLAVAGVPPDYFSPTGQLWGNPLYRWDRMAEDGYRWWTARIAANLRLTDMVRLDHFRGFAGYWRVPAGEETAIHGEWKKGPGLALFEALKNALGNLPLIAEDLGDITPDVDELRRQLALPSMRVLHFAFGEVDGEHAPHQLTPNTVVYTGTHDNDTTTGWYGSLDDESRQRLALYTGCSQAENVHLALTRLAYTSVAGLAVLPLQDVLGLGSEARMNVPGLAEGNWAWRLDAEQLTAAHANGLHKLAEVSGRLPKAPEGGQAPDGGG